MSPPRVHKASLIDPSFHSPALLELVDLKLTRPIIEYLIDSVVETVDYALGRPSHSGRGRSLSRHFEGSAFATCVNNVLERAEVEVPVVLASLVYLDRAKPHLHIALEEWANERVFLGALIVASKVSALLLSSRSNLGSHITFSSQYLNDSSLKNVHWAVCTGVFGKRDIGRIEREFLDVLDFELSVSEADILSHHDAIMSVVSPSHKFARGVPRRHVPALDCPSSTFSSPSPTSTAASFSPRTPPTLVEPEHVPAAIKQLSSETQYSSYPPAMPLPPAPAVHSEKPTHQKKHSHTSSTMRLLRSFPLPRPLSFTGHHHHHANPPPAQAVPSQYAAPRCQPVIPPFPAQPSTRVCV
ncbi:hypothetical protein EW146_g567 [Bondarzewia mesenterica]|uniref:Uncharacterized protein n=1 Tax=Bondarzewia mesenterica TaxID=1095465 RepID=A0A4S4M6K5_9AGAM|nr:hypothetical protein EW146_g567 [Bondarzewia mesenterica]